MLSRVISQLYYYIHYKLVTPEIIPVQAYVSSVYFLKDFYLKSGKNSKTINDTFLSCLNCKLYDHFCFARDQPAFKTNVK